MKAVLIVCFARFRLNTERWSWLGFLFISDMSLVVPGWTGVNERTFIAVKPDGVQRRLVGEIVRRFEKKGFKLVGLKLMQVQYVKS